MLPWHPCMPSFSGYTSTSLLSCLCLPCAFLWVAFYIPLVNGLSIVYGIHTNGTGFLVGAHPGHLHRDEAEEELQGSLGLSEGELPFQMTSRTTSVPTQEGSTQRYSFQAEWLKPLQTRPINCENASTN
jgi:hypothetical protein